MVTLTDSLWKQTSRVALRGGQLNPFQQLGLWIDTLGFNKRGVKKPPEMISGSRPGIGWITLDSAVIRYRVHGKGTSTIVFAADPPIVLEHYDRLIDLLEEDFRVVILEMPGFGFSTPKARLDFKFNTTNDVVAAVLKQIVDQPCVLAFPCVSAYCAIDLATRYPELVRGVVVIQAPSWNEQMKWKRGRDRSGLLRTPVLGQLALKILKRQIPSRWFSAAAGHKECLPRLIDTADTALAKGACFCLASVFQCYLTDEPPKLKPFHGPGLIIWGESDRTHRSTDKQSSQLLIPDATTISFRGAGHFPELEEPVRFARLITGWYHNRFPR